MCKVDELSDAVTNKDVLGQYVVDIARLSVLESTLKCATMDMLRSISKTVQFYHCTVAPLMLLVTPPGFLVVELVGTAEDVFGFKQGMVGHKSIEALKAPLVQPPWLRRCPGQSLGQLLPKRLKHGPKFCL